MSWAIVLILVVDAIVFIAIGYALGFFAYRDVDIRITNKRLRNANNKRKD